MALANMSAFEKRATRALTILLILGFLLVVLATQLGPLCEVVLREVLVISRFNLTTSLRKVTPAPACLDCGVGSFV